MAILVLNGATLISTNPNDTVCKETPVPISTYKSSLPPLKFPCQNTMFLDLDDTLIHSVFATPPSKYDFKVEFLVNGKRGAFYVLKRPFVDQFLQFLSESNFGIVIFTAGVLDKLDPKGLISHRLYRDSIKIINGKHVQDISGFGRDLKKSVIIDDNPRYYRLQPDNAILIKPFTDNLEDDELIRLMNYLKAKSFAREEVEKLTTMSANTTHVVYGDVTEIIIYVTQINW